jgi:HAD superfamily hydrolase (TIGR01509 family)
MLVKTYPLLRHFHSYVLSYKVGVMKPRPLIYQKAIEAAGCQPGECFFTDDLEVNVEAARAQGMDAVQFHSAAQIEMELHKRGLKWGVEWQV